MCIHIENYIILILYLDLPQKKKKILVMCLATKVLLRVGPSISSRRFAGFDGLRVPCVLFGVNFAQKRTAQCKPNRPRERQNSPIRVRKSAMTCVWMCFSFVTYDEKVKINSGRIRDDDDRGGGRRCWCAANGNYATADVTVVCASFSSKSGQRGRVAGARFQVFSK